MITRNSLRQRKTNNFLIKNSDVSFLIQVFKCKQASSQCISNQGNEFAAQNPILCIKSMIFFSRQKSSMHFLAYNYRRIAPGARRNFRTKFFHEIAFFKNSSFFAHSWNSYEKRARIRVDEIDSLCILRTANKRIRR